MTDYCDVCQKNVDDIRSHKDSIWTCGEISEVVYQLRTENADLKAKLDEEQQKRDEVIKGYNLAVEAAEEKDREIARLEGELLTMKEITADHRQALTGRFFVAAGDTFLDCACQSCTALEDR